MVGRIYLEGDNVQDPYIWKFNPNGELEETIIETGTMEGLLISNDYNNNIYLSGSFSDLAFFGNTTLNISSGNYFLAKFNGTSVSANFKITSPVCAKNDIIFENTSMNDTSAYWEFNGGIPATSTKFSDTVRFNAPGIHTVKLISSNGISSDTLVKTIFINPQPAIPVITQVSNTLISNYNSGNLWYYENDSIRFARDSIYQITLEGNYQVKYTDTNKCTNISTPFYANFNGISEIISPVSTAWVKTISGGSGLDRGVDIIQTFDKGFLVFAETNNFPVNDLNTIIIKYDSSGNQEWSKIIRPGRLRAVQIKQASDSGYVLLVNTDNKSLGIIKLSKLGDVVFNRFYKYLDWGVFARSFSFTNDGGYIISAWYNSNNVPMGFNNAYLLKIDSEGLTQWSKILSARGADGGSLYQTADGGYILNGHGSFPNSIKQNFICKLDQFGTIQWIKEYQNLVFRLESATMVIANDDGYIMAGSTVVGTSGGNDAYVLKVSLTGEVEWCKVYGTVYEEKALDIKATGDGYIVVGRTEDFKTEDDLYLFKIDNNGNQLWSHAYGTDGDDEGAAITETNDHGFAITGTYNSSNDYPREGDIYFIKTDSLGNTGCKSKIIWTKVRDIVPTVQSAMPQIYSGVFPDTSTFFSEIQNIPDSVICYNSYTGSIGITKTESVFSFSVYPNPSGNAVTISITPTNSKETFTLNIVNAIGVIVYSETLKEISSSFTKQYNLSFLPKGIYFLELHSNSPGSSQKKAEVKKIVLQ